MTQLVIASKSKEQLEEIAEHLLINHLVISIDFHFDIKRTELVKGNLDTYIIHFITGKTKSCLFCQIDHIIRNMFPKNIPEIYSHPITDMDWDLAARLKSETEKI